MRKTLIIAEAGVNHNGDIKLAKKLIDAAAISGADFVKFQTFKAKNLALKTAEKAEYQTKNIGSVEVIHSIRKKSKSSYNLYKLAKLYGNLVTNFSTVPIHLFSILGLVITLISFLFIVGILIEKIVNPSVPLGYSTLVTIIFFFSGIQILFLGLIGEYVGKILRNVNKEEQYIVDFVKKRNSY